MPGSTPGTFLLQPWRPVALSLVVLGSVTAQTSLPPAQPSDWAQPSGPYQVAMEEDTGLPDHTIYRPADLTAVPSGQPLPIVAFSGPGCDANGTAFRPFFTEVASHGFLVIANGLPEPRGGSGPNFPKTAPQDLRASIDWAESENRRAESQYFNRINPSKVAVMGQSCGGAQALVISEDPRIDTIVMWNSTSFTSGPTGRGRGGGRQAGTGDATGGGGRDAGGAPPSAEAPRGRGGRGGRGGIPVPSVDPARMHGLQVPIAYVMGGQRDILYGGSLADIASYDTAPVFWASLDIQSEDPHAGTFRERNGGDFGTVGVSWLDWRLRGDAEAARMFEGPDCTLCTDPRWEVRKRNMN